MGLNSPNTDGKLLGNLFIGHALCDQPQDLVLSFGKFSGYGS